MLMFRQASAVSTGIVAATALLAGIWLHAADKVELKGSTSVELPKPKRTFEESSRFKFESNTGELEGGFVAPPANNGAGPLDRKLRQMMDEKENWIFKNPYERHYDARTIEVLEKDAATGNLLEHPLLKDEEKSTMQKFIEEKDKRHDKDASSPEGRSDQSLLPNSEATPQAGRLQTDDTKKEDRGTVFFGENGGALGGAFKPHDLGLELSDFQKKMERSPLEGSVFSQSRTEIPKADKMEALKLQEARDAEFNAFIQPRGLGGIGTAGIRQDSLNISTEPARQTGNSFGVGNPIGGRRSDAFQSPTRIDFGSGAGNRIGGLSPNLPALGGTDFGDNSSRISVPTASGLPTALPSPSARGSAFGPGSGNFELQRRKF